MDSKPRIVHYINQLYGGYGGEDTAGMGIVTKDGPAGPGVMLEKLFDGKANIVKTIICGDNRISENLNTVVPEVLEIIKGEAPDLFIAGPGFNAGRYGLACGAVTSAVEEQLEIPAVTALFSENPGTDLYKGRCYILQTDNNAKNMKQALEKLASFARKLVSGEKIEDGKKEGYHGSGPAIKIDYAVPAGIRGINMLLNKYSSRPFQTEVVMPNNEIVPVPVLNKPLTEAKIALVTDGGLVPKGNPDSMVPVNSKSFMWYSMGGLESLSPEDYEVSHQGYNNEFVLKDPNRLVPLDSMRQLKSEGVIGDLADGYYTTAGVMTPMEMGRKFGVEIADQLKKDGVDAVILTST